jgi:hypothetical protein
MFVSTRVNEVGVAFAKSILGVFLFGCGVHASYCLFVASIYILDSH